MPAPTFGNVLSCAEPTPTIPRQRPVPVDGLLTLDHLQRREEIAREIVTADCHLNTLLTTPATVPGLLGRAILDYHQLLHHLRREAGLILLPPHSNTELPWAPPMRVMLRSAAACVVTELGRRAPSPERLARELSDARDALTDVAARHHITLGRAS